MRIDITKPVKLRLPVDDSEAQLVYEIMNYNEHTGRCYISPINSGLPIPCQEIVLLEDLENIHTVL